MIDVRRRSPQSNDLFIVFILSFATPAGRDRGDAVFGCSLSLNCIQQGFMFDRVPITNRLASYMFKPGITSTYESTTTDESTVVSTASLNFPADERS